MYFIVAKGSKHTKEKGSSLESQGEEKTQRILSQPNLHKHKY